MTAAAPPLLDRATSNHLERFPAAGLSRRPRAAEEAQYQSDPHDIRAILAASNAEVLESLDRSAFIAQRPLVLGVVVRYGRLSKPFEDGHVETIAPGAFGRSCEQPSVYACLGHFDVQALGDVASGRLAFRDDDKALLWALQPTAGRWGRAMFARIRNGAYRGTSAAFRIHSDHWSELGDGRSLRTIVEASLLHVAPVWNPQYPDSTVAVVEGGQVHGPY